MKIKALSFAILSSLLLTACGGGDSDSSKTNSNETVNNNNSEWAMYYVGTSTSDPYLFTKIKYSISNKEAYINVEYTADNNLSNIDISEYMQSYLANDGFYDPAKTKSELGYNFGKFTSYTDTVWTYTPQSNSGNTALQLTEKFEKVNLAGKSISEYLSGFEHYAGLNNALKSEVGSYPAYYVQKLQGKTFPEGSTCLRSVSSSSNNDFAYVDLTYDSSIYEPNSYFDGGYKTISMGNYPLYLATDLDYYLESEATTKIGANYYSAEFNKKGTYYTLAEHIAEYERDLAYAVQKFGKNSTEAQVQDAYLNGLKTECALFNKTASVAIDAVR
ncbi:hypothetical protein BEN71_07610 [Acinetobacter wuhouensis]|uniref:hypothetical protein n=1 Tax=Acinetobacter wuhouensis TaxID=1879050 RepID=UPI00083AC49B|nr:hypothetical protein [Acinetobacter wuhouensis]AXQ21935.1 hypothetical protein BEN71_07610 [Acinetobacter wuhouensis]